ncbi:MAG: EF-P beta-lysylation protein EpmB [Thermoanaerobaculia bacterium]|nr:EF-P beta-lysylation protein EpmB [Thermoanaerobaculia bacterium]
MISRTPSVASIPAWQASLRDAVTSSEVLLRRLGLPADLVPVGQDRTTGFPLRVPEEFLARMEFGNARDPLLLQVLPQLVELEVAAGYTEQPLAEESFAPLPGLIHKYRGRVLILVSGACAVHCRYCFRRNFPYSDQQPWSDGGQAVIDYIAADASIREVILSGGDPLAVSDDRLASLVRRLGQVEHLETLRIHTRLPVVIPNRVEDSMLAWLEATMLNKVLVLHANHARELDGAVAAAVRRLRGADVTVLNQAVLLRGVNDSEERQADLSESLFRIGVLPYYLHLLDRVQGAAHFEVSEERAQEILRQLRGRLPGYLVPRLVREVPGAPSKVPV